ncbi:MAG TPA: cyclic nucleotide-binding and patatin-like phospholipase domain-containing protein, partial [Geobacterales bacterium]|nr:cyclic nucleotide-binding and patatin-like phospholipase domain-containing protein [Geobacterales bacterium]
MDSSSRIIPFLARIPQFSAMDAQQLTRLFGLTALKVLAKGEPATVAGGALDELRIVVSGRLAEHRKGPEAQEFGQGAALAAEAFFARRPASATLIALRETVLLTLSWADLAAAFRAHPDLLATCFATFSRDRATSSPPVQPSRLVLCTAGAKGRLEVAMKDAFVAALESLADVRILRRESFGSLALDAPDTAHWLQEQELEFEVTVVVADGADATFAKDAIEEGDEIVFIASSGSPALSALEQYALDRRGRDRCRLLIAKDKGISLKHAADWVAPRPYRSTQLVDFASPKEAALMASALLGKGIAVAATSCGVYAAAILGALQAFEASGTAPSSLAAAGSAILPAGLLASGASLAETEAAFRELAEPLPWKRAAKPDTGLFEAAGVDAMLALALPECNIGLTERPFIAVSLSLSENAPKFHREGRLHSAVRAGLTPPGVLPPFISDDNDILVSGENEVEALVAAARRLSASPLVFLYPIAPALGSSHMSYRQLAGPSFRLTSFQGLFAPEQR